MNHELANAVVEVIACPCVEHAIALQGFKERDWRHSYHWLITSGLALHLLAVLKQCQSEASLPLTIGNRIHALDGASATRTDELRSDFLELNRRFTAVDLTFAAWKGFALEPDFCGDVRLRPQMDFDFIGLRDDLALYDSVLRGAGYERTRCTAIEATYENMPGQPYTLEQVYHPKPQRKVELHFAADHPSLVTAAMDLREDLERRRSIVVNGQAVTVLAPEDAFLSHAAHAGRHALEGWVRLGWLQEIDHFIRRHAADESLWTRILSLVEESNASAMSAAVGVLLANRLWRRTLLPTLDWAETVLPRSAMHWIEEHGKRLAMAEFPGTKLNLLLQREITGAAGWAAIERSALFRRRSVPRVAQAPPGASPLQQARAARAQVRFTCRRIRFHCFETARYLFLKWQWNRERVATARESHRCNAPFSAHSNSTDA